MAAVEQCETQSSGLPSISKTLYDDTFKPSQEEEKDSDEESFHLPMLDCDDDLDSNTKEVLISDSGKDLHNGETEDEILNKFETNGTPDIDPKLEESILNEIDNLFEKKLDEPPINKNMDCDSEIKNASPVDKQELNMDDISDIRATISEILKVDEHNFNSVSDEHENKTNEKINDDKANEESTDIIKNIDAVLEDEKNVNEGTDIIDGRVAKDTIEKKEATEENDTNGMDIDEQLVDKKISDDKITNTSTEAETNAEAMAETNVETNATTNNSNETELSEINTTVQEMVNSEAVSEEKQEKNELEKCIETNSKIDTPNNELNKTESKSSNDDASSQIDSCEEAMEVDSKAEEGTNDGNPLEVVDVSNEIPPKDDIVCEDSNKSSASNTTDNLTEDQKSSDKYIEKQSQESTAEHGEPGDTTAADSGNLQSNVEPEKCENSNDSSKSQNLECEDLLDISIIRDADEDNASAIAENANDAHTSEKSDNDNDDQDEGSDKAENDLDESEMDQDDTLLANDKEDNMDFEDGSSNLLCDQDSAIDGNISDSENKSSETRDSENDSSNSVLKQKSDINDIELSSEKNGTEEISNNTETEGNEDSTEENSKPSTKRSLSETDITEIPNKKIKLTERSKTEDKISFRKNDKIKTLINFEKYMQNKKLENKLTRSDLEQFCLQKICEAIMHKTDVGELHQTIKKQEQIIENLRKDLQQLTKQTRDLDIVNKKLMNELRAQNGPKKPLVPLKITRSVGLQVKLNSSTETNNRRKVPIPTTPRTPTANNTAARPRTITPANAPVVRQVAASPRKAPTSAPLLSQALQNRSVTPVNNVAKRTPVRSKAAEPQRPANASVIDLTDEDDRASKGVGNSVKILNKTIPLSQGKTINIIPAKTVPNKMLNSNQNKTVAVGQVKTNGAKVGTPTRTVTTLPQGVRLTPTQVKNGSITIPASVVTSSSGTTQFMYVVQPGSVVTSTAGGTQKAVLLNFQPTNGVLTSTINGSAVSVLPSKTSNTVQLKTVTAPRKHPAPLPSPPPITINASLKPLLPKPHLSIRKTDTGIILQWRMPYNLDVYEAIASYQLFAYQETNAPPSTEMWRKVGDVKALALPMACTLTQFADKNKYYFAVRSIDVHKRIGAFSDPEEISL